MKTHTSYLTFNTKKRQEIIDITEEVEACRAQAGISEGFVLVSAMHISASVFVNDHESGLWQDILDWLEKRVAPWSPDDYRHNTGTGEDNAAAHLRSLTVGHEVIVPVTKGRLDFGPWQRVFYGEWDGPAFQAGDNQSYGGVVANGGRDEPGGVPYGNTSISIKEAAVQPSSSAYGSIAQTHQMHLFPARLSHTRRKSGRHCLISFLISFPVLSSP